LKIKITIPALLFCVLLALCACSKNNASAGPGNTKDTSAPVVTISSPSNNQTFAAGQTVQVMASATDNVKVTELHVHVLNKETLALLRDIHSYPGDKSGVVQDSFTAQAGMSYTIKIIALDPSQNLGTVQVDIAVN